MALFAVRDEGSDGEWVSGWNAAMRQDEHLLDDCTHAFYEGWCAAEEHSRQQRYSEFNPED